MPSERWGRGPPVKQRDVSSAGGVHHTVLMEVVERIMTCCVSVLLYAIRSSRH